MAAEFLPLCDVLFNVISLAGYFCDVVFDLVLGYALYNRERYSDFWTVIFLVGFSLIISQCVSLRWYMNKNLLSNKTEKNQKDLINLPSSASSNETTNGISKSKIGRIAIIVLHCTQMGVLWRYAKLFVPVDLRHVKHEVRDLCMLRLVHAFCEAAPMLLFQLHIITEIEYEHQEQKLKSLSGETVTSSNGLTNNFMQNPIINQEYQERTFKDLNVVSAALSLFSVCWALASFNKNVRLQNVHRLVLTWLGVIFQFFWRIGTVTSRVIALTVYASFYGQWVFLVIVLHWFSMFLWLISPKNVFHGEKISRARKSFLGGVIAFIYVFAYINLQEVNHRQKMIIFYVVMFLENCMLVFLWAVGIWNVRSERWSLVPVLVFSSFFIGMIFMLLYYRYFHVRRLGYEAGGRATNSDDLCKCQECSHHQKNMHSCMSHISRDPDDNSKYTHVIPGVFNCRFSNPVNGATKRKKKKPTTFVPPPNIGSITSAQYAEHQAVPTGLMSIPFWRRPLPRSHAGSSETETNSVESRVNIHQKLQEKKQKQLAELKIIEEEIKQGKLGGPAIGTLSSGGEDTGSLPRQPIPRSKKHIELEPTDWLAETMNMDDVMDGSSIGGYRIPNMDDKYNGHNYVLNMAMQDSTNRNMSPISQISATESHRDSSMAKQVHPRSKKLHNMNRTAFNRPNIYPGGLYLEINHPRQISGTYSSSVENNEHLPFPYNVIPPPRSKLDSRLTPTILQQQNNLNATNKRNMQRANTPEILLAPHYLENARIYCDWITKDAQEYDRGHTVSSGDENLDISAADDNVLGFGQNPMRIPSDIDSQVSLPRSYTLPREFKYYRRNKVRKLIKNEHFIASTNSSDGDVDSCDDNESEQHSSFSNINSNNSQNYNDHRQNNYHNNQANNFNIKTNLGTNQQPQMSNSNCQCISPVLHTQQQTQRQTTSKATNRNSPNIENIHNNFNSHNIPITKAVNNLDLINGVDNSVTNQNRTRMRVYGGGKLGMVRHETKL